MTRMENMIRILRRLNGSDSTIRSSASTGEAAKKSNIKCFSVNPLIPHPDPNTNSIPVGRHGEGYHNVAESYYGTPAWNVSSLSLLFPKTHFLVLLVRKGWQRHRNLGRRTHHPRRRRSSRQSQQILGLSNCHPEDPHP